MLAFSSQLNYQSTRSNDNEEGVYNRILSICHLSQVVFSYWDISLLKTNTNLIHAKGIPATVMNSQEHGRSLFHGRGIRNNQQMQADTQVYSACLIRHKSPRLTHFLPCKYWELPQTDILCRFSLCGCGRRSSGSTILPRPGWRCAIFLGLQKRSTLFLLIAQMIVIQLHTLLGQPIGVEVSGSRKVSDYRVTEEKNSFDS